MSGLIIVTLLSGAGTGKKRVFGGCKTLKRFRLEFKARRKPILLEGHHEDCKIKGERFDQTVFKGKSVPGFDINWLIRQNIEAKVITAAQAKGLIPMLPPVGWDRIDTSVAA